MAQKKRSAPASGRRADNELLAQVLPRLSQLSNLLNRGRAFEHALERAGLALERPAVSVLATLHVAGQPLRIGDIATRMQVVGPHITRLVDGLVRRGLVRRITDPLDQRARLIELTAKGKTAIESYLQIVFGWFTDALTHWSPHDRQTLAQLVARFVDDLSAHIETQLNEPSEDLTPDT